MADGKEIPDFDDIFNEDLPLPPCAVHTNSEGLFYCQQHQTVICRVCYKEHIEDKPPLLEDFLRTNYQKARFIATTFITFFEQKSDTLDRI